MSSTHKKNLRAALLALILTTPCLAWGMSLSCNDIDVIYCSDPSVSGGVIVPDRSQSGLNATINGSPAFLPAQASWGKDLKFATNTYSQVSGSFFFFTRTSGQNYITANTSLFDWSVAASSFMIMTQCGYDNGALAEVTCLGWSTGGANAGWEIRVDGNGHWVYSPIDLANIPFYASEQGLSAYNDKNLHTLGVWKNAAHFRFYYDGNLVQVVDNATNMGTIGGGAPLTHGRKTTGTRADWGGSIGKTQIWSKACEVGDADGMFKDWYYLTQRGVGTDE